MLKNIVEKKGEAAVINFGEEGSNCGDLWLESPVSRRVKEKDWAGHQRRLRRVGDPGGEA